MQLLKEREADADKGVDADWSPVIVGGTYEARASRAAIRTGSTKGLR